MKFVEKLHYSSDDRIVSKVLTMFSRWSTFAYDTDIVNQSKVSFVGLSKTIMNKFGSFIKKYCFNNSLIIKEKSLQHIIKVSDTANVMYITSFNSLNRL